MIEYKKITDFPEGTLYAQLEDAYSFDVQCKIHWETMWKEYDAFFYSNPKIAEYCGFITVVDGAAVGHISWDPRKSPESVSVGHNCIISKYKGNGYGKMQLQEALNRIKEAGTRKVIVTTNEITAAAQRNYESVGFQRTGVRENKETPFAGAYIDYELYFE